MHDACAGPAHSGVERLGHEGVEVTRLCDACTIAGFGDMLTRQEWEEIEARRGEQWTAGMHSRVWPAQYLPVAPVEEGEEAWQERLEVEADRFDSRQPTA
jgi:hypothetical protein